MLDNQVQEQIMVLLDKQVEGVRVQEQLMVLLVRQVEEVYVGEQSEVLSRNVQ